MEKQAHWPLCPLSLPEGKGIWAGGGEGLGQGALRKGLEPLFYSPEQVTTLQSLSPELRGQLQALLLQRPQRLSQPNGSRPCWGERALPGPRTKTSAVGGSWISPAPSWTRSGLASAQTSTQDSWARGSRGEERREKNWG